MKERLELGGPVAVVGNADAGGLRLRIHSPAASYASFRLRMRWWHVCLALDAVLLSAAWFVAELGGRSADVTRPPALWALAFCVCVVLVFAARGLYRTRLRPRPLDDLREVVIGVGLASILVVVARALVVDGSEALAEVIRLFVFTVVYVGTGRFSLSRWQVRVRREGGGRKPTLVLGHGPSATVAAQRLLATPELGLEPVGFIDDDGDEADAPLPVLGNSSELELVVQERGIEQLLIAPSAAMSEQRIVEIADRCEEVGVSVGFIPQLVEKTTRRLSVEHLGGLPLVFLDCANPHGWTFRIKYALDRLLAALFLCLAIPAFAVAVIAVWCSLGRSILYRQRRVGRDGREFELLKFRTMTDADADEKLVRPDADTAPGGVEGRDRRTRVGSLLRRTSIDELPQLLNVLRGEMSLVGPRPERPEFVAHFRDSVRRYEKRLRVKSGITGWAQVNGLRGKTSLSDRVEWDNHYIENWSLWLDFKILLSTVPALVSSFKCIE